MDATARPRGPSGRLDRPAGVRVVFVTYLLVIAAGLVLYAVIGVTNH